MEAKSSSSARLDREIANLKLVSRLLGHELVSQNGQRITLSRDEVTEIQTSIDLFIESIQKISGGPGGLSGIGVESALPTRVN